MCQYCEDLIEIYPSDNLSFIAYYPFYREETNEDMGAHLFKYIYIDPINATVSLDWYEWDNGDESVIDSCPICNRELIY